jgi:hypothetical protein
MAELPANQLRTACRVNGMGRTQARQTGQSLRLRTLAAFVLAFLFGLQLAPLAQAQKAVPDCCMAAEGKGCSMHLHRAAQGNGHTLAAVQPPCPCTPLAPASASAHGALALSVSHLDFALATERTAIVQPRSLRGVQCADSGGTRGPPAATLAA